MFQFMQKVSPRKVRILGEAITNRGSSLESSASVEAERGVQAVKEKGTTGKISMVREQGQWKIERESWISGD